MLTVGFNNSFIHIVLSEEEYNNLGVMWMILGAKFHSWENIIFHGFSQKRFAILKMIRPNSIG
jgi:hypothetical protein